MTLGRASQSEDPTKNIAIFNTKQFLSHFKPAFDSNMAKTRSQSTRGDDNINSLIDSWDAITAETTREHLLDLVKSTTQSILHVHWQNIKAQTREHLTTTLRTRLHSGGKAGNPCPLISSLIELSTIEPRTNSALAAILNAPADKKLLIYATNANCDVLCVQTKCLAQTGEKQLAVKLCNFCLKHSKMAGKEAVRDVNCLLLFRLDLFERLSEEAQSLYTCDEGIDFVERILASPDPDYNAPLFASCVLQCLLGRDLMTRRADSPTKKLMEIWVNIHRKLDPESRSLRQQVSILTRAFTTSGHYYSMVGAVFSELGDRMVPLYIECYIKGLAEDLNVLDSARSVEGGGRDCGARYADALCDFAGVLGGRSLVARECFLTAFSVDPTEERMSRLEEFKEFGGICHCVIGGACGEARAKRREREAQVDDLSEDLVADLSVVLYQPRNRVLSWELPWVELKRLCEVHLVLKTGKAEEKTSKRGRKLKARRRVK